jgi:hypothetical protein
MSYSRVRTPTNAPQLMSVEPDLNHSVSPLSMMMFPKNSTELCGASNSIRHTSSSNLRYITRFTETTDELPQETFTGLPFSTSTCAHRHSVVIFCDSPDVTILLVGSQFTSIISFFCLSQCSHRSPTGVGQNSCLTRQGT